MLNFGMSDKRRKKSPFLAARHYVRLRATEPEVLKSLGIESKRSGTASLTLRQINQIIKAVRAKKPQP